MSSYLICSTPAHGHVMPLLVIGRHLRAQGHRVRFLTGARYRDAVVGAGLQHVALPEAADVDLDRAGELFPERAGLTGPAAIRFDMSRLFLRPGAAQHDALTAALAQEPADAVLSEGLFLGAALLSLLPRSERPPVVALGIFPLGVASRDTAPFGLGMTPLPGWRGRLRNALMTAVTDRVVFGLVNREADELAAATVGRVFQGPFLQWSAHADALVQLTVPSFEYPRSDLPATVHFAGPLPSSPSGPVELPSWWGDLDGARPVVHVTQGTVANTDLGALVRPTIEGLADRDVLVVVSTGGRDVEALGAVPDNVRVSSYLPYAELFPRLSALVTNGGYGGVQQALAHGIPLVVAGRTEDKIEVTARVGWSGAGIDLRTVVAQPRDVATAVDMVLTDPRYRAAAQRIGADMRASDPFAVLSGVLSSLANDDATTTSDVTITNGDATPSTAQQS